VLQCVAVCCSVLQYTDIESEGVLDDFAAGIPVIVCCSALQYVAVCYSVLQCVAVCCSVLQNTYIDSESVANDSAAGHRPQHIHTHTNTALHLYIYTFKLIYTGTTRHMAASRQRGVRAGRHGVLGEARACVAAALLLR